MQQFSVYQVTVFYREPTYELVTGPKSAPYSWVYWVPAFDTEDAKEVALQQFDETAKLSSVGWVRQIVHVDAEPTTILPQEVMPMA